jgi:hypothetical protein
MKGDWFKCDGCEKIRTMDQRKVVKAQYTAFDGDSLKSHQYFIYHVQLCPQCYGEKGQDTTK